jgi:hypothetical protein
LASPQVWPSGSSWQLGLQPSAASVLPSSHSSAAAGSRLPSPQLGPTSTWQEESQPSPSSVLPSSHCSPSVESRLPSPQLGGGGGSPVESSVAVAVSSVVAVAVVSLEETPVVSSPLVTTTVVLPLPGSTHTPAWQVSWGSQPPPVVQAQPSAPTVQSEVVVEPAVPVASVSVAAPGGSAPGQAVRSKAVVNGVRGARWASFRIVGS